MKHNSKHIKAVNTERFEARANILLRGRKYSLQGSGRVDPRHGTVYGCYNHNVKERQFDSKLFQTVLVTGYPSVCINQSDYINPFTLEDYNYERYICLGEHGSINYTARCFYQIDDVVSDTACSYVLKSEFDVDCDVEVPLLNGACPLNEVWLPNKDYIKAEFLIKWPIANSPGEFVRGIAKTKYLVSESFDNQPNKWERHIKFHRAESEGSCLQIVQQSWLDGV